MLSAVRKDNGVMRFLTAGASLALVIGLASPAAAQSKREMQMMADIRMLQEQTQQLQQQMQSAITTLTEEAHVFSRGLVDGILRLNASCGHFLQTAGCTPLANSKS